MNCDKYRVQPGEDVHFKVYDPSSRDGMENKKAAKVQLKKDIRTMSELQYSLYAENRRSLLIILQAMDAAGKDSVIRHVMSGVNPQGCEVYSFKHPSAQELEHDYIWRHYIKLPDRGRIGIFNRSYYENVLISRVHPELLLKENLPNIQKLEDVQEHFWKMRFRQINHFEQTITENGTTILKFFLHLSKEEQKNRFLERINNPQKNWKFSAADIEERQYWQEYMYAYEQAIQHTSSEYAPWYIIPADHKWFNRVCIGNIIVSTLQKMNLTLPEVSLEEKNLLIKAKKQLTIE